MARRNLKSTLIPRLVGLTRLAPAPVVLAARPLLAAALRTAPGLRGRVERSMTAALGPDGWEPRHVRQYFAHLADLAAYSILVYRSGFQGAGLDRQWFHDPETRRIYLDALDRGKGVLMAGPHVIGHEVMVGSVAAEVPVSVLARKSPDPEYEAIKQRWYDAIGVNVIHRPDRTSDLHALAEMTTAMRALRKNHVLALTPDLVQKPGSGVPVRLFGRPVELPAGPFFLAVRTGAPLIASFCHMEEGRYRLWAHPPLQAPDGDRDAAIAHLAQGWTTLFEEFVRCHPDMWQFWLDKRWSRWLSEGPGHEG